MKPKFKPILISLVVLSVVSYLIYAGVRDTMTYYLTVSEVLAQPSENQDQTLRVGGNVSPGSVQWDPKNLRLLFTIKDEKASIAVDYRGVVPDSFKPGVEIIIEGTYTGDGKFKATTIMPKCASKYV
ncbi:MAG: cytochrome c maturation protein CcmE [Candidatus Desulfatibia sp.]|uniref:cytochrome c maturation protein CcmE n=1 Tax=Candidatus Desulfatibia sp. TaxID=3101189 RepID=UPI002F30151B